MTTINNTITTRTATPPSPATGLAPTDFEDQLAQVVVSPVKHGTEPGPWRGEQQQADMLFRQEMAELRETLCLTLRQVAEGVTPKEYITIAEAAASTGLSPSYIRDLAQQAGITKYGRGALDRQEFFRYWRYRGLVEQAPRPPRETARARLKRINRDWKRPGSFFSGG